MNQTQSENQAASGEGITHPPAFSKGPFAEAEPGRGSECHRCGPSFLGAHNCTSVCNGGQGRPSSRQDLPSLAACWLFDVPTHPSWNAGKGFGFPRET